jgi:chemotaxis protein MotB
MITLILVFFVLLFSMSQIDQQKFEQLTESFQNRMVLDFLPSIVPNDQPSTSESVEASSQTEENDPFNLEMDREEFQARQEEEQSLNELLEDVESYLNENGLNDIISANRIERGVILVLQDSIFFDMGEAEILEEGEPFLQEIGSLFSEIPNDINVEGHTDNRPINTYRYPSNWELSGARASSVVRYLLDTFDLEESRFSIAGYGETRPLVSNESSEDMSMNRRVEITILNSQFEN